MLTDAESAVPEAVGYRFDCTILASDALRPLADLWCRHAKTYLLRIGATVEWSARSLHELRQLGLHARLDSDLHRLSHWRLTRTGSPSTRRGRKTLMMRLPVQTSSCSIL